MRACAHTHTHTHTHTHRSIFAKITPFLNTPGSRDIWGPMKILEGFPSGLDSEESVCSAEDLGEVLTE